ncbi:MAG TPA: oligosaccharide flippase family protein [Fimbriimonas sp.]|nr:oligosaccharide flippase family protein [Fimbriimonas sp.]
MLARLQRFSRLFREKSKSGALQIASGTALGQAIGFIALPVISRLYNPGDINELAAFTAILSMTTAVASMRFDQSIPLAENDDEAAVLYGVAKLGTVTTSLLSLAGFVIAFHYFNPPKNLPVLGSQPWLLGACCLLTSFYLTSVMWGIRQTDYKEVAKTKVIQGVVGSVLQLFGGFLHLGFFGLVSGQVLGQATAGTKLSASVWKPLFRQAREGWAPFGRAVRKYKRFPLYLTPAALLNTAALQLPALLVNLFFPMTQGGFYGWSMKIGQVPSGLIGTAIAQVFMGEASKRVRNGQGGITWLMDRSARTLAIAAVIYLALCLVVSLNMGLLFGAKWRDAGFSFAVLSVANAVSIVGSPLGMALTVTGNQPTQLRFDMVRTPLVAMSVVAPHLLGWSFNATMACLATVMSVTYVWYFKLARNSAVNHDRSVEAKTEVGEKAVSTPYLDEEILAAEEFGIEPTG